LGGVLNPATIPRLKVGAIAGGANNQLLKDEDAELLRRRGIAYAPDFVANAGGMIRVASEMTGFDEAAVTRDVAAIETAVATILDKSAADGISAHAAALALAADRLGRAGGPA